MFDNLKNNKSLKIYFLTFITIFAFASGLALIHKKKKIEAFVVLSFLAFFWIALILFDIIKDIKLENLRKNLIEGKNKFKKMTLDEQLKEIKETKAKFLEKEMPEKEKKILFEKLMICFLNSVKKKICEIDEVFLEIGNLKEGKRTYDNLFFLRQEELSPENKKFKIEWGKKFFTNGQFNKSIYENKKNELLEKVKSLIVDLQEKVLSNEMSDSFFDFSLSEINNSLHLDCIRVEPNSTQLQLEMVENSGLKKIQFQLKTIEAYKQHMEDFANQKN